MSFLKLGIHYLGTRYHLLWINPQPQKKELFFQFITDRMTRKAAVPTYKDGKILSEDRFWDHLSIHSDGTAHIRTKGNKYVQKLKLDHSIYDYGPTNIVPLLSNTYGISACPDLFKKAEATELTHEWQLAKPGHFTMLIFMVQYSNYQDFLDEYIRPKLGIRSNPILMDMGNQLHLLMILLTAQIPIELNNGYLSQQIKMAKKNSSLELPAISFGVFPSLRYLENGLIEQQSI